MVASVAPYCQSRSILSPAAGMEPSRPSVTRCHETPDRLSRAVSPSGTRASSSAPALLGASSTTQPTPLTANLLRSHLMLPWDAEFAPALSAAYQLTTPSLHHRATVSRAPAPI